MLVRVNPFNAILNREPLFDDFFKAGFPTATRNFEPNIDVLENDKEFVVKAELPGLSKDDFKLTVENNTLTLEGEKKFEREDEKEDSYRLERRYGAFRRSFRLTDSVDSKKIEADYKNGVLEITIPKAEKAKPKQIEVGVS